MKTRNGAVLLALAFAFGCGGGESAEQAATESPEQPAAAPAAIALRPHPVLRYHAPWPTRQQGYRHVWINAPRILGDLRARHAAPVRRYAHRCATRARVACLSRATFLCQTTQNGHDTVCSGLAVPIHRCDSKTHPRGEQ